jgi:hypothetical protein
MASSDQTRIKLTTPLVTLEWEGRAPLAGYPDSREMYYTWLEKMVDKTVELHKGVKDSND